MVGNGEEGRETIRPEFDRSIMMDFQGAKITSDTGFLLLREIDGRFGILGPMGSEPAIGVDHQAFDRGRSESRVSWLEVASPCGVGLPLGWILRCVRPTRPTG